MKNKHFLIILITLILSTKIKAQCTITASGPIDFCQGDSVILTANGGTATSSYQWIRNDSILSNANKLTFVATITGNYTVMINACLSSVFKVTVNTAPSAPIAQNVSYCRKAVPTQLTATGINLLWYTAVNGGVGVKTITPSTTKVGLTDYYVTQTDGGCESARTEVPVLVNGIDSSSIIRTGTAGLSYRYNFPPRPDAPNTAGFQWLNCDDKLSPVIGATNSYYTAPNGNYALQLKNFGCIDTSNCYSLVCNTTLPQSSFTYITSGNDIAFLNTSTGDTSSNWSFWDGATSTIRDPFHSYTSIGDYNVCLLSSSPNTCGVQITSQCKLILIKGLSWIYPTIGNNSETAESMYLYGSGFTDGLKVFLRKNGQANINSDSLSIYDYKTAHCFFNLADKAIGKWDIVCTYPSGDSSILNDAFEIKFPEEGPLWVNINGDYVLRIGFNQIYTVQYGNNGTSDASLVPLIISGLPIGTNIEVLKPLFRIDTFPALKALHFSQDSLKFTYNDSSTNTSYRLFYINNIPAGGVGTLGFIFHVPDSTTLHSFANIKVIIGSSLPDKSADLSTITPFRTSSYSPEQVNKFGKCFNAVLSLGASVFSDIFDFKDIDNCITGVAGIVNSLTNSYLENGNSTIYDVGSVFTGGFETTGACLQAATTILVPESRIFKAVEAAMHAVNYGLQFRDVYYNCSRQEAQSPLYSLIGNAWDPNEKFGPGDSINGHFINMLKPVNYTINFENSPNANQNAQTIIVTDTLNPAYFDFTTFRFTSVILGDSVYALDYPATFVLHDFDFTKQYGVKARAIATFDSTKGTAIWKFLAIDPTTNQPTLNALSGLLPPDIKSPNGQGYVSYIVSPNKNITNGDTICNAATIVFDKNPAIKTKCWQNIFDLVNPKSSVLKLPAYENNERFAVKWAGTDNLSGIMNYDIYVAVNDSASYLWKIGTTITSDTFTGIYGKKYSFYSIATDKAGNREQSKTSFEASTIVQKSDSLATTSNISAYPNPTNQLLNISIKTTATATTDIILFDILGRKVKQLSKKLQVGNNTMVIDVSALSSGIYILKAIGVDNLKPIPIVITR